MALIKRSFTLHGHRTSLALEPEFWAVIDGLALEAGMPLTRLIARIDRDRDPDNPLSSSVRVWALNSLREKAAETRSD
ncbi:hypothetical protein GCM10011316_06250 [Roseibium aquae]|uniref:Ribbon-helix-helix domain-containing protein n=1 Tax=Roseibium aquae TaxID=1323746 RepID=A0A916TAV3_9HYPH|nr:ribbon-helix-helix domain-containing protein [Roseibium aquae]GGB36865.1 hypothetical protein GCM10011316_06250 [Roseibium aquae]